MVYEHSAVCLCVTATENTAGKTEGGREKKGGWGWRIYDYIMSTLIFHIVQELCESEVAIMGCPS